VGVSAVAQAAYGAAAQPLPADATGQLYERHHRRIFGFCLGLLGSREDAEDAVQTTFINAQRGLHRGVVPEFELAWLFTIARNVCYTSRESSSRRRRLETVSDLDALQDSLAMPERDASVSIGELAHALEAIPERQRRALLLREFQGLSYGEIAAELGISVAAVETLIFRARRSVTEQLQKTSKSFGGFTSLLTVFRWFFKGGAAPLKLAAATATVATTATFALVPLTREHAPARAPVTPAPAVEKTTAIQHAKATGVARRPVQPAVSPASGRAPAIAGDVPASGQPAAPARAPAAASNAGANSAAGPTDSGQKTPSPPIVTLPSIALPPVTIPPVSITVPEINLPAVTVPAITVPAITLPQVDLPQVELPKLP
jgi:RNA polymerase sigma-70 factor, ECF subfamily